MTIGKAKFTILVTAWQFQVYVIMRHNDANVHLDNYLKINVCVKMVI